MTTFKGQFSPCCHAPVHWDPTEDAGVFENPYCDECAGDVPIDADLTGKILEAGR